MGCKKAMLFHNMAFLCFGALREVFGMIPNAVSNVRKISFYTPSCLAIFLGLFL